MPAPHDVVVFAPMHCLPLAYWVVPCLSGLSVPTSTQDYYLFVAAKEGSIPKIRAVLEQGVNPNTTLLVSSMLCVYLSSSLY